MKTTLQAAGQTMKAILDHGPGGSASAYILLFLGGILIYNFFLVIYRLYLHPLARFPGPKICAASEVYEFYCYILKGGQWGNAVREMHEQYGTYFHFPR